jgi:flagellar operon protein
MEAGDMKRLEAAVEKARQKGSKDTLLLMGENAFIVNVKNNTVVTAMDRAMMKENVFTNIDSTIVL